MKGATQTIPVVMAIIIAVSILVLGFNILGRSEHGIDEIENSGMTQKQRLMRVQSLAQACDDWLYGDKYNAKAILETYDLPNKMRPYRSTNDACGEALEIKAKYCLNADKDDSRCATTGMLKSDTDEVLHCTKTCSNIINIQEMCEITCPENTPLCFENLINDASRSDLQHTLSFSNHDIEEACK